MLKGRGIPGWLPWFLKRLLSGLGAVLASSVIVFMATQALPSDPARVILGPEASEESIHLLQRQLGLDRPVAVQYADWLGRLLRGGLGHSLDSQVPVTDLISARFGNTLVLLGLVALFSIPLSLAIGVALALRRDSRLDRAAVTVLVLLKALPSFALAIGLISLLSTSVFSLLPAVSLLDPERSPLSQLQYLVLPTLTLVLSGLPYLTRLVRGSMIEALEAEYVTLARLRGVPERRVVWRHALPNALIPAIQGIALMLSVLFGGTLIVEVVFTYPGIGSTLNAAVQVRDLPVIQAVVLIVTAGVVAINLVADLLTVLLTPRLRTAGGVRLNVRRTRRVFRDAQNARLVKTHS
ncbi:peptide ABC transporter permease [Panacagrimonas perspica]|nr:peptide ABC transporter permease [Panacagrimonas perspica]